MLLTEAVSCVQRHFSMGIDVLTVYLNEKRAGPGLERGIESHFLILLAADLKRREKIESATLPFLALALINI
jgi:hypothetical protein